MLGERVGKVGEGGEGGPEEADQVENVIGRVTGGGRQLPIVRNCK